MSSFGNVHNYATPGTVPVCEKSGRLCTVPITEISSNLYMLKWYPEINLSSDVTNLSFSNASIDSLRSVMIPVNEGVLKRITRTFFELGFADALNEARDPHTAEVSPILASLAEYTFKALNLIKKIRGKLFANSVDININSIAEFSETRDWVRSIIRCIAWHRNCFKLAVAGSDDIIRIYTEEVAVVPILKSSSQKWITSMAWRPYTVGELAVGCKQGICIWTIYTNLHKARTSSQVVHLKHPQQCPITSLEWNEFGSLLASASIGDKDILIWNIDKMESVVLKRVGPPCSILKWSPDGSSLFSATTDSVFRVWSTNNKWTSERWTINSGNIQSACWSPCGSFLLFVTSDDSLLYRLQLFEEQLFTTSSTPKMALPIADLSKTLVAELEVGGKPQAMAWDPNGINLAIIYKDTSFITVFTTSIQKFSFHISPSCFISGIGCEYPTYICFQSKNHENKDTVLTIGWSSGRIQYFPFGSM